MPKCNENNAAFYPAYCFKHSPTYNTWARLSISDVHALKERPGYEGQNIFFHGNHPIRWVRLVGVIVAFDVLPSRFIFALDDSSGATIDVTCERHRTTPPNSSKTPDGTSYDLEGPKATSTKATTQTGRNIDLVGFDVGTIAKVKGAIGLFRGERQVLMERIARVSTTNEEAAAWQEVSTFHESVLDHPWVVSEQDQRRARKKVEGGLKRRQMKQDQARTGTESRNRAENDSARDVRDSKSRYSVEMRARQERGLESRQIEKRKRQQHLDRQKKEHEAEKDRAIEAAAEVRRRLEEAERRKAVDDEQRLNNIDEMNKKQARRRREADRAERERIFAERQQSSKDLTTAPVTKQSRKQRRTDNF